MNDIKVLLSQIYKFYAINPAGNENYVRKKKIKEKDFQHKDKLLKEITDITKDYAVVDWTEEESCCYEFKILLHKNQNILDDDTELIKILGYVRYDLRLFVSILGPYYYLFEEATRFVEKQNKWEFNTISQFFSQHKFVRNNIEKYFLEKGYQKISDDIAKYKVLNIETELKHKNEANIFDCLFTDLVTLV